ncbi:MULTISPECIES: hypothetical protein [Enterobacter]|nr:MULTISPECIES: hypothetical protein [Enterobacter]NMD68624.1 hypothetical protein [Enterobacter sp. DNRA5]
MQASPSCSNMNVVMGDGPSQREKASTSSHGEDKGQRTGWKCFILLVV